MKGVGDPREAGWYAPTGEEVVSNIEGDSFDPSLLNLPAGEGDAAIELPASEPVVKGGSAKKAKAHKAKKVKEPKVKTPRPAKASDGRSFLTRLAQANPYNVLLGIGVAALLIAILFMVLQLAGYGFALKPTI
jgi:hypothetical protein